jgi:hypothetical protein
MWQPDVWPGDNRQCGRVAVDTCPGGCGTILRSEIRGRRRIGSPEFLTDAYPTAATGRMSGADLLGLARCDLHGWRGHAATAGGELVERRERRGTEHREKLTHIAKVTLARTRQQKEGSSCETHGSMTIVAGHACLGGGVATVAERLAVPAPLARQGAQLVFGLRRLQPQGVRAAGPPRPRTVDAVIGRP